MRYVALLRGINVGGRNKIAMADLRKMLEQDFTDVASYIQSGNVVLTSDMSASEVSSTIEVGLSNNFELDSDLIRVLVLSADAFQSVLEDAPPHFGAEPDKYRYDVGFYVGVSAPDVAPHLMTNPEVDEAECGELAFYYRRLSALASRSRMSRLVGSAVYPSVTIRNWRTTTVLADLVRQ